LSSYGLKPAAIRGGDGEKDGKEGKTGKDAKRARAAHRGTSSAPRRGEKRRCMQGGRERHDLFGRPSILGQFPQELRNTKVFAFDPGTVTQIKLTVGH